MKALLGSPPLLRGLQDRLKSRSSDTASQRQEPWKGPEPLQPTAQMAIKLPNQLQASAARSKLCRASLAPLADCRGEAARQASGRPGSMRCGRSIAGRLRATAAVATASRHPPGLRGSLVEPLSPGAARQPCAEPAASLPTAPLTGAAGKRSPVVSDCGEPQARGHKVRALLLSAVGSTLSGGIAPDAGTAGRQQSNCWQLWQLRVPRPPAGCTSAVGRSFCSGAKQNAGRPTSGCCTAPQPPHLAAMGQARGRSGPGRAPSLLTTPCWEAGPQRGAHERDCSTLEPRRPRRPRLPQPLRRLCPACCRPASPCGR